MTADGGDDEDAERRPQGAAAAAAAMDALDAEDEAAADDGPEREETFARYRELPPLTSEELAEHVRGGTRVVDGGTHQTWDWTNGDVARCVHGVFAQGFVDPPAHRELTDAEGFDGQGNRVTAGENGDAVAAGADVRFTDIVRDRDGTRHYGTGRGLETPEIQFLRTRYQQLSNDETVRVRQEHSDRRFDRRVALVVLLLVLVLVAIGLSFLG